MPEVRWDNYSDEPNDYDLTQEMGKSLQITFDELRNENGERIAEWIEAEERWRRTSDGKRWTDIAW